MSDEPVIQFTVKDYLADMDRRHTAQLSSIDSKLDSMATRVEVLENDRITRQAGGNAFGSVWRVGQTLALVTANVMAAYAAFHPR